MNLTACQRVCLMRMMPLCVDKTWGSRYRVELSTNLHKVYQWLEKPLLGPSPCWKHLLLGTFCGQCETSRRSVDSSIRYRVSDVWCGCLSPTLQSPGDLPVLTSLSIKKYLVNQKNSSITQYKSETAWRRESAGSAPPSGTPPYQRRSPPWPMMIILMIWGRIFLFKNIV